MNDTPTPAFDANKAQPVPLYRHDETARTVAWSQPSATPGAVDLFSPTFVYVATEAASPAPETPAAPTKPGRTKAQIEAEIKADQAQLGEQASS